MNISINKTNIDNPIARVLLFTIISLFLLVAMQLLNPTKAHAASITVGGVCTLDDAVASVNAASDQSGCTGSGAYGTADTIDIPAGTHSYSATAAITDKPVIIQGAGMGQTIIDSGDANAGLIFNNTTGSPLSATISDLSIRGVANAARGIGSTNYSMTVTQVEIYSTTASDAGSGIIVEHNINGLSSTLRNIYVHDVNFDSDHAVGINVNEGAVSNDNMIDRLTVNNVSLLTNAFAATLTSTVNGGTITGTIQNSTITNVEYINPGGYVVAYSDANIGAGTRTVELTALNNTIVANRAITSAQAVGLLAISLAPAGQTANATIIAQNNIITSLYQDTPELLACNTTEYGLGGTESAVFTSLGGNITDDGTTCNSFLTQTNDQTGVTALGSTLGPLQDNGGPTPTIALLTGSPAIDNGITNALSTDQRGIARPQGSAFDTGAFELAVANPDSGNQSGTTESNKLANTGQDKVLLSVIAAILLVSSALLIYKKRLFSYK